MSSFEERAWANFVRLAVQYYAAGRFSAMGRQMPVAGHLLHHAIEMLLKASLIRCMPSTRLRKLGHDLSKLWSEALSRWPALSKADYELVVKDLNRFETIRYPDHAIVQDAVMLLIPSNGWDTRDPIQTTDRTLQYVLRLGGVDRVFHALFQIADANPKAFFALVPPAVESALGEQNSEAFWRASG